MDKIEILQHFEAFNSWYDAAKIDAIWQEQSRAFREFWHEKILNNTTFELNDSEIDQMVRFFDKHARGNTREDEAVAQVMISQGVWRKMLNEIKQTKELSNLLTQIFEETDIEKLILLIDELYRVNAERKNSLTGKSGNAINTMLFVYAPERHVSMVSLRDREKAIKFFGLQGGPDFENDGPGKKIVMSNQVLVQGIAQLGLSCSPRTFSTFLYNSDVKDEWRAIEDDGYVPWGGGKEAKKEDSLPPPASEAPRGSSDISLFYMESQLEDFLIENWERTELGQKYDLIEENDEIVSQQYQTGIGRIDILAQDKQTKQLVVIELKKNQTSDDTVGQLTRYMGWLEEHKTNGQPTKGIIIAAQYDTRLYYALKKVRDVEVYLYRVGFSLRAFEK